jgi:hypothetical protein
MNIFVSDESFVTAATNLDDKRLVKMVLETAQLLATAIHINNGKASYKPTHINHPATIWVARNKGNYTWLFKHFVALNLEYSFRYNKVHKCAALIKEFLDGVSILPDGDLEQFANCTTNKEKGISFKHIENPVEAYKAYLSARWDTDTRTPKWTNRQKPEWYRG